MAIRFDEVDSFIPPEPLGLRPKHIAKRQRMFEIIEAYHRYIMAEKKIPQEWINELSELNAELKG